jgi:transposase InsO family protein
VILAFVDEARSLGVSERSICRHSGISRRTLQQWRTQGMVDKRKGSQRHIPHRFTAEEEQHLYAMAMTPEFRDATPEQIVAILASRGEYYGSPRTLYRILKKRSALHHRRRSKKPTPPRPARYLEVTSPNQVWSWDITWLKTEVHGLFLYAYTIIDLYDRSQTARGSL